MMIMLLLWDAQHGAVRRPPGVDWPPRAFPAAILANPGAQHAPQLAAQAA
jgi:hypothetical protein